MYYDDHYKPMIMKIIVVLIMMIIRTLEHYVI